MDVHMRIAPHLLPGNKRHQHRPSAHVGHVQEKVEVAYDARETETETETEREVAKEKK